MSLHNMQLSALFKSFHQDRKLGGYQDFYQSELFKRPALGKRMALAGYLIDSLKKKMS